MLKKLPAHIPQSQAAELTRVVAYILQFITPEKIILFGSYARGDFVVRDDTVVEGRHEIYQSDFDLLVIVKTEAQEKDLKIWSGIERHCARDSKLHTPVSLIRDTLDWVNAQLKVGSSFYADAVQDGIVLFEKSPQPLAKARKLSEKERRHLVLEDLAEWYGTAKIFYRQFQNALRFANKIASVDTQSRRRNLNLAAFELHQATERAYMAIWLATFFYKPKWHDLEKLAGPAEREDKRFAVFARADGESKRLFELLRSAYVDARYKKSYHITPEELKVLAGKVRKLLKQVERLQTEWEDGSMGK